MSTSWDSSTIKSNKHHHSSDGTVRPNQRLGKQFPLGISRRELQWEAMSGRQEGIDHKSAPKRRWSDPFLLRFWEPRPTTGLYCVWRHHIKSWTALRLFSCKGGWPPAHSPSNSNLLHPEGVPIKHHRGPPIFRSKTRQKSTRGSWGAKLTFFGFFLPTKACWAHRNPGEHCRTVGCDKAFLCEQVHVSWLFQPNLENVRA